MNKTDERRFYDSCVKHPIGEDVWGLVKTEYIDLPSYGNQHGFAVVYTYRNSLTGEKRKEEGLIQTQESTTYIEDDDEGILVSDLFKTLNPYKISVADMEASRERETPKCQKEEDSKENKILGIIIAYILSALIGGLLGWLSV